MTHQLHALDTVAVRAFPAGRWSPADRCAELCEGAGAAVARAAVDTADPVTSLSAAVTDAEPGTVVLVDLPSMTGQQLVQWHDQAPRWAAAGVFVVAFSPFGLSGPYAGLPGNELVVQAASGLMSTTGYPDDPPLRTGVAATTTVSAFVGFLAVLASRVGEPRGDVVDVAQFDVGVCLLGTLMPAVFVTGQAPKRIGNRHPMSGPWNTYPTRDGWVVLTTIGDQLWHALARLMDRTDLIDVPRYATADGRVEFAAELDDAISAWTGTLTTDEVVARATSAGVPSGEIRTLAQAVESARSKGRITGIPGSLNYPLGARAVGPASPSRADSSGELPLYGVRVVEVGSLTSAPLGGRLLGMLGADVVKVEPPSGELSRHMALPVDGSSYLFHINNTDKRSVVYDIRRADHRAGLQKLLEDSDAFLANLAPSTLRRFDLDPDHLGASCPGIVHCTVSGFGFDAPPAADKAFDTVVQAMTGVMDTTGLPDGPPIKAGFSFADLLGGFASAAGVLCGLLARRQHERSVAVDIAMEDLSLFASQDLWTRSEPAGRLGNLDRDDATSDLYRCSDGWLALGPVSGAAWSTLAGSTGAAAPPHDALARLLAGASVADALALARSAGIAASPPLDLAALLRDPQVAHRGLVVNVTIANGESLRVLGRPMTYLRAPVRVRTAAPRLNPGSGTTPAGPDHQFAGTRP